MKLVLYPDPILKQKAVRIPSVTEGVKRVAAEMIDIMTKSHGIGLAGNQVDYLYRIIVINPTGQPSEDVAMINPVISGSSGSEVCEEGCLSFPEIIGKVKRAQEIVVEYTDLNGDRVVKKFTDIGARVVQHEVDHLDGILLVSRISLAEKQAQKTKLKELEKRFKTKKSR